MKHLLALPLAAILFGGTAQAQTLAEIDKRDAAVLEAWNATPLTIRRAIFVDGQPTGFGQYVERANNAFKKGDKFITYAEPVGYGFKDLGGGVYQLGFKVDIQLKSADGSKVIVSKDDFAEIAMKSHARNREFNLLFNLSLGDTPPGDYLVEYKLHDIASTKTVSFSQPFKIVE